MRYIQFQIVPSEGTIHPLNQILREDDHVTREAVHHLRLLADDTVVGLYELEGRVDHLEATFEEHPAMIDYTVSRSKDIVYVHSRSHPTELLRNILAIQHHYDIVIDPPIEYTEQGGFRITSVGMLETLRDTAKKLPNDVDIVFENTGEYTPQQTRPFTQLTDRQQEVITTAAELGYYEEPHQCTYEDIAAELGLARETVGEHLRKAEATFVEMSVP